MRFVRLLLTIILFISHMVFPFFPAHTLIKTADGSLCPIDQIGVSDIVAGMSVDGKIDVKAVTHKYVRHVQRYVVIVLDNDEIITAYDQKIYAPTEKIFKHAEQFKIGDMLLAYSGEQIPIRDVFFVEGEQEFFDITVAECHTFFVSRSKVLVHNMIPVALGLSWVFGGGLQFAGASLMTTVLGSVAAVTWKKNKNENYSSSKYANGSCDFFFGMPPDDEFEKQGLHGRYVESPKHHENVLGNVSKAPKNGQKALDQSIRISDNSSNRIGVSEGEIVELKMTRSGEYHGHVVKWEELHAKKRGVLLKTKMVNHKGKILI